MMHYLDKIFKKPNTNWVIWVGVFLSYIIVGLGVYLWQNSAVDESKKNEENIIVQTLTQQKKNTEETALLQKNIQGQVEKIKNNQIDIGLIKIGDTLPNGMTVGNIFQQENKKFIEFTGSIVVSGNFVYGETLKGKICLNLDKESIIKVPKTGEVAKPLCFTNTELAQVRFGSPGSTGEAEVVVDSFRLRIGDPIPFDEVELIKTLEINK
ncbi:MAG TPA: hypothetical protein PKY08_00190 [Candidatus Magasanikbacteria bacterium]|nr:hypothetical protein [Candidatus Magasanikbacteria bacterium]